VNRRWKSARRQGRFVILFVLPLLGAGCFYQPPVPGALRPLEEGDTALGLQITYDALTVSRGQPWLSGVGFFPVLRYALNRDQEVLFFPWPAYRHWMDPAEFGAEQRGYHQVSLGGFVPLAPWISASRDEARRELYAPPTQYLRYDFRRVDLPKYDQVTCECSAPSRQDGAAIYGFGISLRGGERARGELDLTIIGSIGYVSEDAGVSLEPTLLTTPIISRWSGRADPPSPFLTEVRMSAWGGR
jgi:hypothetical protein